MPLFALLWPFFSVQDALRKREFDLCFRLAGSEKSRSVEKSLKTGRGLLELEIERKKAKRRFRFFSSSFSFAHSKIQKSKKKNQKTTTTFSSNKQRRGRQGL
jgi:hypothetical protein